MGKVINFEDRAVARLQARVAAAEEANQDLIAFARGHSGAVASIHEAVLAALSLPSSLPTESAPSGSPKRQHAVGSRLRCRPRSAHPVVGRASSRLLKKSLVLTIGRNRL